MAASKKPGDETIPATPDFLHRKDTYVEGEEEQFLPNDTLKPGAKKAGASKATEAAPEVSQGAWRERTFTPRGVMPKEEVILGLETALRVALQAANLPTVAFQEVRREWMPFLRQAMEQAGGDGMDAWLLTALKPPGRRALDPLMTELVANITRMRMSKDLALFEEASLNTINDVKRVLGLQRPRRLSFKQMERELEGKIEVDELMNLFFCDDNELTSRLSEIGKTMEALREQLKTLPGAKPDGMYSNFSRLKAELRVLNAELARRRAAKP